MVTGATVFQGGPAGNVASRSGDGSKLQVRSDNGDAAADELPPRRSVCGLVRPRPGQRVRRGGWSDGAVRYKFWTEKNFDPNSRVATAGGSTISGQTNVVNGGVLRFLNPAADANDGKIGYRCSAMGSTSSVPRTAPITARAI